LTFLESRIKTQETAKPIRHQKPNLNSLRGAPKLTEELHSVVTFSTGFIFKNHFITTSPGDGFRHSFGISHGRCVPFAHLTESESVSFIEWGGIFIRALCAHGCPLNYTWRLLRPALKRAPASYVHHGSRPNDCSSSLSLSLSLSLPLPPSPIFYFSFSFLSVHLVYWPPDIFIYVQYCQSWYIASCVCVCVSALHKLKSSYVCVYIVPHRHSLHTAARPAP